MPILPYLSVQRPVIMKIIAFLSICLSPVLAIAQMQEEIFSNNIKTVQLHSFGNQLGYPVIRLNSGDQLELHFDDLGGQVRNYSYTYQLCNADWTPAMLSHFDYIKGFSQARISNYRVSSIAFTKYTHYQAVLPERNCMPSRSGNYLLKVFADGDTSKLLFTRRLLVVDEKASVNAQVQQPYNGLIFRTHQKIQFKVNLNEQLNLPNPLQQIKVTILQNERWDNAIHDIRPSFVSRLALEYNTENDAVFPAGKEWRWLDLRSLRFQSDRIADAVYSKDSTTVFLKPDISRVDQRFNFYRDANGRYSIATTENVNPLWQTDYATVHFRFLPPGNILIPGKDIYVFGKLTNYKFDPAYRMEYDQQLGMYTAAFRLKQGYYDYCYVSVESNDPKQRSSMADTEGNLWETENDYMILIYYRPLGGRVDELISVSRLNSLSGRR